MQQFFNLIDLIKRISFISFSFVEEDFFLDLQQNIALALKKILLLFSNHLQTGAFDKFFSFLQRFFFLDSANKKFALADSFFLMDGFFFFKKLPYFYTAEDFLNYVILDDLHYYIQRALLKGSLNEIVPNASFFVEDSFFFSDILNFFDSKSLNYFSFFTRIFNKIFSDFSVNFSTQLFDFTVNLNSIVNLEENMAGSFFESLLEGNRDLLFEDKQENFYINSYYFKTIRRATSFQDFAKLSFEDAYKASLTRKFIENFPIAKNKKYILLQKVVLILNFFFKFFELTDFSSNFCFSVFSKIFFKLFSDFANIFSVQSFEEIYDPFLNLNSDNFLFFYTDSLFFLHNFFLQQEDLNYPA